MSSTHSNLMETGSPASVLCVGAAGGVILTSPVDQSRTSSSASRIVQSHIINSPNVSIGYSRNHNGTEPHLVSTPVAVGGSVAKRLRRDDSRVNPFEKHVLEQLHRPIWSSSVLSDATTIETPPQRSWGIDQLSLLNPSHIEDSPSTHQNEDVLTPHTEAKAQHAISTFFSQRVAPSPSPEISPISHATNETTESFRDCSQSSRMSFSSKLVNTDLSFPPVLPLDVELLLSSISVPIPADSDAAVNTSLTRRKLDFTFESSGTGGDIENQNYRTPGEGGIIYSPGLQDEVLASPRHFRSGLDSPRFTPIKGSSDK